MFCLDKAYRHTEMAGVLVLFIMVVMRTSQACVVPGCGCSDYQATCINPSNMFSVPDQFSNSIGELHIEGAKIYVLSLDDLGPYVYIWNLTIIHSELEYIESDAFWGLSDLLILTLSHNLLSISDWNDLLNAAECLETFDLAFNQIRILIPDNRYWLYFLRRAFIVTGNPLHCNCDMKWLFYFMDVIHGVDDVYVSAFCYSPAHLKDKEILSLYPHEFKCRGPHIKCTPNRIVNICEELYMECKSFGDPQPNMTVTLPDGTREFVNASDNQEMFVTYVYQIPAVDPTTGFGTVVVQSEGYEGLVEASVSWTMTGDCGACWKPCTTIQADNSTATEYSTTQSDDIITKAVNRTDEDDENIEEEGVVTGPVLAAAGVGLGMGIGTSLFALGVKNLIQKYKQGPSAPFRSGQVFVES